MVSAHAAAYRSLLRELYKASVTPGTINKSLSAHFRAVIEKSRGQGDNSFTHLQNAILSLRSQREYKSLLERYNPLIDLTGEERIQATARRVGLDMPITHQGGE